MATVATAFREPASVGLKRESNSPVADGEQRTENRETTQAQSVESTTSQSAPTRIGLLDFPPGVSPSPLPTIDQTPNRFLQNCTKLDLEPNPFEVSFLAQQNGAPIPEPPSGVGFASSPNPILPPLVPSPRFNGPLLTPISAALASLGAPITTGPNANISAPAEANGGGPHIPPASETYTSASTNSVVLGPHAPYSYPGADGSAIPMGPVHTGTAVAPSEAAFAPPSGAAPAMPVYPSHNEIPPAAQGMYGPSPFRHAAYANGIDPMLSMQYPPHSPQAAAATLLDMRRDQDRSRQRPAGHDRSSWAPMPSQEREVPPSVPRKRSVEEEEGEMPGSAKRTSPPSKARRRSNASNVAKSVPPEDSPEQFDDMKSDKKVEDMDPEEKRRTFLERNRQAALKCRQKKKQWLQSLQAKVDFLTTDNENLQNQATQLREEILNLKTLLLAHRDCPIAKQNGLNLAAIEATLPISSIQSYSAHRLY
ncbi:uncharacterized protein SPPG_01131 [Spizellomyces punctatus DAOM BR117]|uniref:BZIP domain-containing protein n=1 Tax=Spizellomyces punctatus (strain DAOM BR117) TaxID=645134 RepID=A0A0L0HQJ3_SPIPD|nr:uncharacterized protein SPPG_01131 [Spizellomyces punctatus DAOM BR117]KND03661.1 hypothetical protein SPPG_01131 [Spizellomyces punctatus DAOM BR117]|eukprot:XP_016611700.1 hypothetical protein SPPG_01131 [Spizellomyces punctatus DAOM BR117]